jgi:RsiW-degrading membrane proteinase PrsW (M82 family)
MRVQQPTLVEAADEVAFGDLVIPREMLLQIARDAAGGRARGLALPPLPPAPVPPVPVPPLPPSRERQHQGAGMGGGGAAGHDSGLQLSEFIPVLGAFERMKERGLLLPTLGFAALLAYLWSARATPTRFVQALGVFTVIGALYFVYRLCGRRKPLLAIGGVMVAEWLVLQVLFFTVLELMFRPPWVMALVNATSVPAQFVGHFFAAGMMEECAKMLPVVGLIWLTRRQTGGAPRWGVTEPLDAVLFACASAAVFVMDETLLSYVPRAMRDATANSGNAAIGLYAGLSLAIVRTLDSLTGHLAFSGYFGYFVGLSLLRPKHAIPLVAGGYLMASAIHALGNATSGLPMVSLFISATSFVFLVAVILNARKVSPTRHENFATMLHPTIRGPHR